jgi:3-methyladenine DNA glycosylase/8-oxoguanine DNA glycosylase
MPETVIRPVGPYSLAAAWSAPSPSRRVEGGALEVVYEAGGAPAHARVRQRPDGLLAAAIASEVPDAALRRLRFLLAVDDDHSPFLAMAATDPLLRDVVARRRGRRPLRTGTVAQSLLHAMCGQLITAREAWAIERRISARIGRTHAGLVLPPTADDLRAVSPAELARLGLAPRRAAALARVVRTLDPERLRGVDTARVVARLTRERTLGPWTAGVVCLHGLGRYDHGLVGDLGLVRLCSRLSGRPADADDTARLLARYGDWAGLAGMHLLTHPLTRRGAANVAA